ncbi:MAG: alpha/beta fold hydrolase [Planctomyces sp.]|nr:alpha/beta fold hydrolase [Planctomyces sp.]
MQSDSRPSPAAGAPSELKRIAANREGFADEYPFTSNWFSHEGHAIHYLDEGTGPVLLMVHGNPTWSFAWRNLIKGLRDQYRIIAVDHLGCGFSEKPQDRSLYTLDLHIRRLMALVESLGLQKITLIGHDWGGAIGMGTAVRIPERFERFILMNTAAFRSSAIPRRIALCRIPWLGRIGVQGFNLFAGAAIRMAVEHPLSESAAKGFLAPYDKWEHRVAVHEFVQDIPLEPSHISYQTLCDVENGLEQFRHHPMLLAWGMKDWCFTPSFFEQFRSRFPDAQTHCISDAGHYIFEDAKDELLSVIRKFLQGVPIETGHSL